MSDILDKLNQPLPEGEVSQREGAFGKMLDYIESWFVIQQANDIFGYDGWSTETTRLDVIGVDEGIDKKGKPRFYSAYRSTVRVTATIGDKVTIREGSGYGDGMGKTPLETHEIALKEAESDAQKRALKSFGQQFGLHLYDKDRKKVDKLGDAGFKNMVTRNEFVELINLVGNGWTPELCELETLKKYARRAAKTEPALNDQFVKLFTKLEDLQKNIEAENEASY